MEVNMLKVIIVDDEYKVCQVILNIIDWKEMGFEIVAVATNGIDAYDLIVEHNPDVLITDIRMPGLNGIELIKKTVDSHPDISFMLISGYAEFEYAQKAIKYGVEHYLLKPIKKEDLIEALEKISKQYYEKLKSQEAQQYINSELTHNREIIRSGLMNTLLFEPDFFNNTSIDIINTQYLCNFKPGQFQVVIFKCDKKLNRAGNSQDKILLKKLSDVISSIYSKQLNELILNDTDYDIICILNFDCNSNCNNIHKVVFKEACKYADAYGSSIITLGLGSIETDISNITGSLNAAIITIKSRIIIGNDKIISYKDNSFNNKSIEKILTNNKKQNLINYIETNNKNEIKNWFLDLQTQISKNNINNIMIIINLLDKIKEIILMVYFNLNEERDAVSSFIQDLDIKLYHANSLDELINIFCDAVISLFANFFSKISTGRSKTIQMIKQYISENYSKPIKLHEVATLANYSTSYFSIIFKQVVGVTFSDYLINIRINAAKNLLRTTRLNILDISQQVGYNDIKNFTKLFRKNVGVKPSSYRKLYK